MPDTNYVLLVADSLRYDVATEAHLPYLKAQGRMRSAWAHGTYTWPSHQAMLMGHLPHCFDHEVLYNRYRQQLFRLGDSLGTGGGKHQRKSHLRLPSNRTIVHGFRTLGYQTIATGAVTWFQHPYWGETFDSFRYQVGAEKQLSWALEEIAQRPFFLLVNFGETHEPYSFGSVENTMPDGYQEHKLGAGPLSAGDFQELRGRQRAAVEYLDPVIEGFLGMLPKETVVVFTSDHGECFGEDGFFGHGFYRPEVMEVPLLIFDLKADPAETDEH